MKIVRRMHACLNWRRARLRPTWAFRHSRPRGSMNPARFGSAGEGRGRSGSQNGLSDRVPPVRADVGIDC